MSTATVNTLIEKTLFLNIDKSTSGFFIFDSNIINTIKLTRAIINDKIIVI